MVRKDSIFILLNYKDALGASFLICNLADWSLSCVEAAHTWHSSANRRRLTFRGFITCHCVALILTTLVNIYSLHSLTPSVQSYRAARLTCAHHTSTISSYKHTHTQQAWFTLFFMSISDSLCGNCFMSATPLVSARKHWYLQRRRLS